MITIKPGEIFCKWYNRENNTNLTPREIFRTVIAPILFYGVKDLVCWGNSKWFYFMKRKSKDGNLSDFDDVLDSFCDEVESDKGGLMDFLKVYGGCATPYDTGNKKKYKYEPQTTAFLYSENMYYTIDERYYSWIGSAFLTNVSGFYVIFDNEEYIKLMFESIKRYRETLNNNAGIKGNQVFTWNTLYFYNYCVNKSLDTIIEENCNGSQLKSNISFEHFIYVLAKRFSNVKYINLENFGSTNITCGTIFVDIPYVKRMADIFEIIYKDVENNEEFSKFDFNKIFGGGNVLYRAIECGAVYEGFFDPLKDTDKKKKNDLLFKYINIVMKEENKELARKFVDVINKLKKEHRNNVKFEVSTTVNGFVDNVTDFIKKCGSDEIIDNMVDYVISVPYSEFKLITSYLNFLINK